MKKIWVEYLRLIALISVITIHTTSEVFKKFGDIGLFDWWVANILNTSSRIAVPLFVMISGCVLLGRNMGVKEFYVKRGIRLLPAFFFWSLFYIVLNFILHKKDLNIIYILKDFTLKIIVSGETSIHLWYLSMYGCLMIFVPFINNYILAIKPTSADFFHLFLAFSLFFSLNQISNIGKVVFDANMAWFKVFPWYIAYFIMGYVIDVYKDKIIISKNFALLSICIILTISCSLNYIIASDFDIVKENFVLYNTGILNFILTSLIFYLFSANRNNFRANLFVYRVSAMSFGIYLIHPLFLKIFRRTITSYLENPTITIAFVIPITFIISFFTISVLTRFKWFKVVC